METARVSSAGAVVFIRNSVGDRYPSAECGIGLLSVLMGTFEHGRDLMALHKHYPGSDSKVKVA